MWNEPDIGYWQGTGEEYFKLYDFAADAVDLHAQIKYQLIFYYGTIIMMIFQGLLLKSTFI